MHEQVQYPGIPPLRRRKLYHPEEEGRWDSVTDAEWIKQKIGIKDDTFFFEKAIGIKP